jgi:Mg2+/citrate symporter
MIDTGLFDPLIRAILRVVHDDPVKIVVGTAHWCLWSRMRTPCS